jgi:4-amino-4-deoxy-L-arabinose transferase-like glycosyltransferase
MFLSILAFVGYLYKGRRMGYLLLSAVAAGLAWLTKSPAFFLAPFAGLMLMVYELKVERSKVSLSPAGTSPAARQESGDRSSSLKVGNRTYEPRSLNIINLRGIIFPWLVWFGVAAGVFVLLWPAMWVDPLGSLSRVFSQATAYASEGHEIPTYFYGDVYLGGESPWYFYPLVTLWRITPVTLLGLVLAVLALIFPRLLPVERERRRLMLALLLFSVLFTIFMSLGAKKFDRYLLPVFAPLNVVAALGWLSLEGPARRYVGFAFRAYHRVAVIILLCLLSLGQLFGVFQTYPYYLNYYNPLLGGARKAKQVMMVGWGEGLDQAARYLNALPRTNKERAIAWYGDGCFSYFFDGTTVPIGLDFILSDLRGTDFVVLYLNQWQRGLPSAEFMAYFEQFEPSYVVRINGVEYVRVYNLREVP